jgi:hypothetical protein
MGDYARQHDFSAKDALSTGDAAKLIKGSEVDEELDAVVTAVATKATVAKGSTILSGTPTVPVGSYFDVSGTTTIAAFTVAADRHFFCNFTGIMQLTHNSTDLDLPGAANITTAVGDVAEFFSTGINDVQCVNYTKVDGTGVTGSAGGLEDAGGNVVGTENAITTAGNFTVTNGKNLVTGGPFTIASSHTVTVGSGETWTVV